MNTDKSIIKIIIIDAEPMEDYTIGLYCENYFKTQKQPYQISLYNYHMVPFKKMHEADIIILIMNSAFYSSLSIAKLIRNENKNCLLCLISENTEFAMDAFRVHAFDYIVKPINQLKINMLLDEVCLYLNGKLSCGEVISCMTIHGLVNIDIHDILYFEYVNKSGDNINRIVCLHTKNNTFIMKNKISNIYAILPKQCFSMPHVAFIVNLGNIEVIKQGKIMMINQEHIPLSQKRAAIFKNEYREYRLLFTRDEHFISL